ncbi:MAG: tripartite tricarboxylate transporter substrate binding protein [Acetobacteraceae bacterium]|nr:tripartite tricarboxylate transporter substrate binding protein [Acetobacteraceae bacterium]
MNITRRGFASLAATPAIARAQAGYPERPVTLVAPFSAGGAADIAARTLAAHAPRLFGLPTPPVIVVENRTGASGAVGTQHVARARPDGYTLLLARVGSSAILPATDPRTPYALDDFTWLAMLDENPFVICVRADAPWRSLGELVAALRDAPGRLNFATSGPATILDLGVRHMLASAGLPLDAAQAIPFRGGGEALTSLLGGQTQFVGNNLGDMMGAIQQGQVRALVVSGETRLATLPDVPTAAEAGMPALSALAGWNALAGPAELPEPVMAAWGRVTAALAGDADWLAATRRVGSVPRILGPQAARAHVERQLTLYRELARRLGLA